MMPGRFLAPLLVLSIIAATPGARARLPGTIGDEYLYDSWQREHGLPQVSVNAIVQDHRGYLWVGTEDGLARFDGTGFLVFDRDRHKVPQLQSHTIRALLPDRDDGLWIATRRGLARLRMGDRLDLYTTADGLANDDVRTLYQDREGHLWIGTEAGLSRFHAGSFSSWTTRDGLLDDSVWAILEDRRGGLWIGTEGGLQRFENDRFTAASTTREGLAGDHVRALYEDRRGRLWIGTSGGLTRFEGGRFTSYTTADGLPHPVVNALLEDHDGQLWIGTDQGLARLYSERQDPGGLRPAGLLGHRIRILWQDHERSLWVGAGILGLVRVRKATLTTRGAAEGLADDLVWTIYQDRAGDLWIGTNKGLSRLDAGGGILNYTTADGLPGPDVRALLEDRHGNLWIGTEAHGLARFRDGEFATYNRPNGLADAGVFALLEDRQGALWIGTGNGLNRLEDGQWHTFDTADGLSHNRIWALHEDPRGVVWIGTESGLTRYASRRFTPVALPVPDIVKTIHSNGGSQDRQGTLWLGTAESGLLRYHDGELRSISVAQGLFDHQVHEILDDDRGWMWMSSNQGIFRVSRAQLEDFAAARIDAVDSFSYGEGHGMRSRECNGRGHPAGFKTRDGRLWFSTIKGVVIVDPERLEINDAPPRVHIEEVLVDRQAAQVARPDVGTASTVLPPNTRELALRYVALSFLDPEKLRFRYRLENFDRDWVDAGIRRVAYYTNLDPGSYRFRVIASNSDGVWNEVGDTLELYLRPAFYQTWLFYLACAVAVALSGWGFYLLRVRQLLFRNRELLRMKSELELKNSEVEARHAEMERFTYAISHDLKSPLVTIRGYLGFVRDQAKAGETERMMRDIQRIDAAATRMAQMLDELLELSRVGRITNKPTEISVGELARDAVDLVAGRIAERGVEIEIASGLPTVFGDRPRLLATMQNLIDNAAKFMGDQPQPRIWVGTRQEADETVCFVRDNGIGIDPSDQQRIFDLFNRVNQEIDGTGIGLALVTRIVEVHGGRIWVESEGTGRGSSFCFTLPSSSPW